MATKKDLVEAYSFSRRRLVTAFVSGAPGGREVEPNRPGRAIIGGLALAVLLVAGGAVLGILKSPSSVALDEAGKLVSDKDTGADYLVLDRDGGEGTELRPLANITSAMLVLGDGVTSEKVPASEIKEQLIGAPIGILDAPATPPEPADLIQSGWSACTGVIGAPSPTGIKVDVSDPPATTPTPDLSFVVKTPSDDLYLIAESEVGAATGARAYAYPIPKGDGQNRILNTIARASTFDARVPQEWVQLFPSGGALKLTTFGIAADELETPWRYRSSVAGAGKAEVGDVLDVGSQRFVMTGSGLLALDDFSGTLYDNLAFPGGRRQPTFRAGQAPGGVPIRNASDLRDAFWPTTVRTQRPRGQLCAQLEVGDRQPGVVLATTDRGSEASAVGVGSQDVERSVDSGKGAFVQSGSWSGEGSTSPVLVDARGYAYPVGPGEETANLGYGGVERDVVPQDWLKLFQPGVPLTIDAARCPPTSDPEGGCS